MLKKSTQSQKTSYPLVIFSLSCRADHQQNSHTAQPNMLRQCSILARLKSKSATSYFATSSFI